MRQNELKMLLYALHTSLHSLSFCVVAETNALRMSEALKITNEKCIFLLNTSTF